MITPRTRIRGWLVRPRAPREIVGFWTPYVAQAGPRYPDWPENLYEALHAIYESPRTRFLWLKEIVFGGEHRSFQRIVDAVEWISIAHALGYDPSKRGWWRRLDHQELESALLGEMAVYHRLNEEEPASFEHLEPNERAVVEAATLDAREMGFDTKWLEEPSPSGVLDGAKNEQAIIETAMAVGFEEWLPAAPLAGEQVMNAHPSPEAPDPDPEHE